MECAICGEEFRLDDRDAGTDLEVYRVCSYLCVKELEIKRFDEAFNDDYTIFIDQQEQMEFDFDDN
jgi:hypothetical protein